jgi:hypothetical protein
MTPDRVTKGLNPDISLLRMQSIQAWHACVSVVPGMAG